MSLATTSAGAGGAGGGGGLVMAHQANAMARPAARPPSHGTAPPGSLPPPPSAAALGADLVDKHQQSLTLKQVKNQSTMPMVALDLYATEPHVALFPPKPKDPTGNALPVLVGKMKPHIFLQPSESSHKTFRKYLTKTKGYTSLSKDSLGKSDSPDVVKIDRPQQWLGFRRFDDVPEFIRSSVEEEETTPAIAEEASANVGVTMANSTLDCSVPQGDDYDRVVFKVRLAASKKAITVLPEEFVQLMFHQAQYHVAHKQKAENKNEEALEYPCSVGVPSWYCRDAAMEAILDSIGDGGVLYQRSLCALAGALIPLSDVTGKTHTLLERIKHAHEKLSKAYQLKRIQNPDAPFVEEMLVILLGLTHDGFECTAVQLSSLQPTYHSCLVGNYKVLSTVGYQHGDPQSIIEKCTQELQSNMNTIAPEAGAPIAIVTYGTSQEQEKIASTWNAVKSSRGNWGKAEVIPTKPDCVAMGTALLGAVSHGRICVMIQPEGKKPKPLSGIRMQNVATVAVGVRLNYYGGAKNKWTQVKTIFDFDRRVPAGPYAIDLNAAECAVHRDGSDGMSEEELLKATKANEGSRHIPKREEAALNLRVQVLQKWSRDGEWKLVGDVMSPLVKIEDDGEEEKKVACESVSLELSLGTTGLITNTLVGERESVVQATKTARNSTLRCYLWILLAVAFFGGFLVKSWWEEQVFLRDTKRLLAFYKHVVPGSMQDGDERNARYLVWKYRGNKQKLWNSLELKYGSAVLHAHEWEDYDPETEAEKAEQNDEEENLDDEGDAGEKPEQPEGDESDEHEL